MTDDKMTRGFDGVPFEVRLPEEGRGAWSAATCPFSLGNAQL